MFFAWLKKYLPRGLYGRAALILLVPVVVIQLVVLVAFSQRYFDDITRQLMAGVVAETRLYQTAVEGLDGAAAEALRRELDTRLGLTSTFDAPQAEVTTRPFYDVSSRVIEDVLRDAFPGLEGADFSDPRRVRFSLMTEAGRLTIDTSRLRASASNPHQLLVLSVSTSLVMTLIAFLYLRNQLRPIRKLARAAEAFGRGEILPYRPTGASEVRSAGAAFLNMRARIERHLEQRTLMLSGVSHDLRTPLTRLRLELSLLEASGVPEADLAPLTQDLDDMERLVTAFLDFARGESGEEAQKIDLEHLVSAAVDRAGRGGFPVAFAPTGVPVEMTGRPDALGRAIDNLLGNAARYATRAQVTVRLHERAVVVAVEDDGPGIEAEARERAVEPFVRLDSARNQNKGSGVGLGLAIATDIARRHGGTLRLSESADLGGLKAELVLAR